MNLDAIIKGGLEKPRDAIFNAVSRELTAAFPDKAVFETEDGSFGIDTFAYDGHCRLRNKEGVHSEWSYAWNFRDKQLHSSPYLCWFEIDWEGKSLQVVRIQIAGQHCDDVRQYVIADSFEIASAFFGAVCDWCTEVRGEILIFADGHWSKSADLYESIQSTRLADLILQGSLKEEIVGDFRRFFEARETYAKYGIPWKRGVILLGPPGNGKTHMIKGLVNELKLPCLYVRSFHADYVSDQHNISNAFERARMTAPCLFVLEDLDSLLDDGNRSFFLNELDGFYSNEGILTVATTNHPERLDPAILDRPSRFDRKYMFELPEIEERRRYLKHFGDGLQTELRLDDAGLDELANVTEGFSFAYLKELYLSGMMAWINDSARPIYELMAAQAGALLEQMITSHEALEPGPSADQVDPFGHLPKAMAHYARRAMARRRR